MPIYEYECTKCRHRLEVIQNFCDTPLIQCPECNRPSLRKLVSAAAFHLKGTGWYATDFKNNDKKKPETKKPSADKPDSSGSTAAKSTDEKPEAASGESPKAASPDSDRSV
ncbi:MAG: zinc ribbon domain-containing protein [Gammaproteobacteria bacterium]|nr:zinc ribbon domain-containing protein [Gammaproteobacteria bacterium]MCI0590776.1 zinc ribbon domain-containing protein [Gammaproteobacteria bacterium]